MKSKYLALLGGVVLSGAAHAAVDITFESEFGMSQGGNGHKPKIQRTGDGTLVTAYGDTPVGAGNVYDVKANAERPARDIFVRYCKPDPDSAPEPRITCDLDSDWSSPLNISKSADKSSISTAWQGGDPIANRQPVPGDIDKPNIKTAGSVQVLTWVSNYCPDGDVSTLGVIDGVLQQRAVRYLERDGRILPFRCTWISHSENNGRAWSEPVQLSSGARDAKQDSSFGGFNATTRKGQFSITWQEDPLGLQLGDAEGPGDGGSGAKVSNGTDVWYTYATIDLNLPAGDANRFAVAGPGGRVTDNQTTLGIGGTDAANPVFASDGLQVDKATLEDGQSGASRPNVRLVGSNAIVAYEETKGSEGLDEGKYIRYHSFAFNTPPNTPEGLAGCIISNPLKNARRVRLLGQSAAAAGAGGIQLAVFWKEGIYDRGGPSDIVLRRGVGGVQTSDMQPTVDPTCTTSDYTTAIGLSNQPGENLSSNTPTATTVNLTDSTEANYTENALAHRGVLRGDTLWLGFTYTNDLVRLWAQLDNYNFWLRRYTLAGGWENPVNVTNVEDKRINVREPRIFSTPGSNSSACPSGSPTAADTTDPTLCQNADVVFLAWGTQENVSPFEPEGGSELSIYLTTSRDRANTFADPLQYSTATGSLFDDDDAAFESQVVSRPDGKRFYGMWNQASETTSDKVSRYRSGKVAEQQDPEPDDTAPFVGTSSGGGCTMAVGETRFDPMLPLLLLGGLIGVIRGRKRNLKVSRAN